MCMKPCKIAKQSAPPYKLIMHIFCTTYLLPAILYSRGRYLKKTKKKCLHHLDVDQVLILAHTNLVCYSLLFVRIYKN